MVYGTHHPLDDRHPADIWIYISAELPRRGDAKCPVFDSGDLVGDGMWEGLRLYDGVLVFVDAHLDRLWDGAAGVGMDLGLMRRALTGPSSTRLRPTT